MEQQCGAISMYNDPSFPGIRVRSSCFVFLISRSDHLLPLACLFQNYTQIFKKQLTLHGLFVSRLAHKYGEEFYRVMVPLVKEGKIKHREDISRGLETAGQGILDVQQGKNTAKKVILVAEE